MLGPGKPAKRAGILAVRELAREEVLQTPRAAAAKVKKLRESHHRVARLFAVGLRPREIAEVTGYSAQHISQLYAAPAMKELIAAKVDEVDEEYRDAQGAYYAEINLGRIQSARQIREQMDDADETGEQVPLGQLIKIHADFADRTGWSKRKEVVTFSGDFAALLEARRLASARVVEGEVLPSLSSALDGAGEGASAAPVADKAAQEPPISSGSPNPEGEQAAGSLHPATELAPRLIRRR